MPDEFEDIGFTEEQQEAILKAWNSSQESLSLQDLGEKVFGSAFTIRNGLGKKLKKFIASRNIKKVVEESSLELTDSQKVSIIQNLVRLPDTFNIAQFIFPGKEITKQSREFLIVEKYVNSIKKNKSFEKEDERRVVSYKPPQRPDEAIAKVNKSTFGALTREKIEKESNLKTNLTALVRFLNSFRFALTYESFSSEIEQQLFETTFIKYTWDKPDLTEEEVDQYINLASDIVNCHNLKKELSYITDLRDAVAEDSDGRKISMSLVESMANIRKEMDDNLKRQDRSISALQGKRSNRIDTKIRENASILQIVQSWRDREKRLRFLKLADQIKDKEKKELERLDSIDALKSEMWGLNPESYNYTPPETSMIKDNDTSMSNVGKEIE